MSCLTAKLLANLTRDQMARARSFASHGSHCGLSLASRAVLRQRVSISGMRCRPAGSEVAEEGKKKSEEEVKAEQEAVSKEQTGALKKALSQITVSLNILQHLPSKTMGAVPNNCNSFTVRLDGRAPPPPKSHLCVSWVQPY